MAHVVTNKCVGCKFTDCVLVCPVACFYELECQLVIHPEECIDCMACVDVCPVHAIYAGEDVPPEFRSDIEFNATEARRVQESGQGAIETKKDPLPTAAQRKAELGYYLAREHGRKASIIRSAPQPINFSTSRFSVSGFQLFS